MSYKGQHTILPSAHLISANRPEKIAEMIILFLLAASFNFLTNSVSHLVADPTTVSGTISQTTTTFYTPPTKTSTFFVTYTPPTSVKMVTKTATPSTSIVVSVTVANINRGGGRISKLPKFLGGDMTADASQLASRASAASKSKSKKKPKTKKTSISKSTATQTTSNRPATSYKTHIQTTLIKSKNHNKISLYTSIETFYTSVN